MSQKPALPPQNCNQENLGAARRPPKSLSKKPQVEWVVQLGPFTDGQISAPELVRPLEGPTDWVIRPKNGEIQPFDANRPPEKDVIRKYLTVGAQDNDVPEDLPKLGDSYQVERVRQDIVPDLDSRVKENEAPPGRLPEDRVITEKIVTTERIVIENEGSEPPECKPCELCKPCEPKEPECKEEEEKEECKPEVCKPTVDANDDCASTDKNTKITIDVLKNDEGVGTLKILGAEPEHGTVKVIDGKLEYTPKPGFTGEDSITYSISDGGCATDEACVFVKVKDIVTPDECEEDKPSDCSDVCDPKPCHDIVVDLDCDTKTDECKDIKESGDGRISHSDHEYASSAVSSIFDDLASHNATILDHKDAVLDQAAEAKSWASSCYSQQSCAPACPVAEESCAVC